MPGTPHTITLSAADFSRAFPFFFTIEPDLTLGACGASFKKLEPTARPGGPLHEFFELIEPGVGRPDARRLDQCLGTLCVWRTRRGGHRLRGELVRDSTGRRWLFLGTPWLGDISDLERLGLDLADFARHDAAADLLVLLGMQRTAMGDLQRLATRLEESNRALNEAEHDRSTAITRLLTLLGSLHGGVLLEDADRRIVLVNEAFCQLFAIPAPPSALVGMDCSRAAEQAKNLFREPDEFVTRIESLLIRKELTVDDELATTDGRVLLRDYIPLWQGERYLGHFWFYRDVSTQRRAATLLAERKRRLEDIMESLWDAVITTDAQGRVTYANLAAERLLGQPAKTLAGLSLGAVLVEPSGPAIDAPSLISKWRDGPSGHWERERTLVNALGGETPALVRAGPLRDGRLAIAGLLCVCKDLAAERRADRQKRDFIATVSHELRNPLNAMLGMTEMLIGENDLDEPARRELVQGIQTGGQHLLSLVNDLLDHARIEAGAAIVEPVALDPRDELKSTLDLVRAQAARKRLTLAPLRVDGEGAVLADPRALRQILLNLLGNAVKFTPEGGTIGLQAGTEPGVWRFDVVDTGPGISRDDQHRLFQPFVQLGACQHTRAAGTGLGLATARRLVELQGGDIRVESESGAGSRFIFRLPRVPSSSLPVKRLEVAPPKADGVLPSLRALLVEDHDLSREMLTALLEMHGCDVVATRDGTEAIRRVEAVRPHLIITDLRMIDIDGLELTRRLRKTETGARAHITVLTGFSGPDVLKSCAEAGANDHLVKPIEPRALELLVQRVRSAAFARV